MKKLLAILAMTVLAGCSQDQDDIAAISADNIVVKLSVDSNSIIF
jgi:hypothetical protein